MHLFQNELHSDFGSWPLAYIATGGAEFGEIRAVAEAVGAGDDSVFHAAWAAAGDRLSAQAAANRHTASARALYLRAAVAYGASLHPLYGAPVDPRLAAAFAKQKAALTAGLALGPHPVRPIAIPFGAHALPGYLLPAIGHETETRPLLICTNGYDATLTDMIFAVAIAATQRGYHALVFDGPGQGAMLVEHNIPLRPDWETVIRAVVDYAVAQPIVDPARIALSGWSLGGYLAPRGASGEPRIAALIADPGTWSIADGFRDVIMRKFNLSAEAAKDLGALDPSIMDAADAFIRANPALRWKVVQRGFWVHGVDTLRGYLASTEAYTMRDHVAAITCPTLITAAENDGLSSRAGMFFEALHCKKLFLRLTAAEGADGHCSMQNRSLLNQRVLDWLDEQFNISA